MGEPTIMDQVKTHLQALEGMGENLFADATGKLDQTSQTLIKDYKRESMEELKRYERDFEASKTQAMAVAPPHIPPMAEWIKSKQGTPEEKQAAVDYVEKEAKFKPLKDLAGEAWDYVKHGAEVVTDKAKKTAESNPISLILGGVVALLAMLLGGGESLIGTLLTGLLAGGAIFGAAKMFHLDDPKSEERKWISKTFGFGEEKGLAPDEHNLVKLVGADGKPLAANKEFTIDAPNNTHYHAQIVNGPGNQPQLSIDSFKIDGQDEIKLNHPALITIKNNTVSIKEIFDRTDDEYKKEKGAPVIPAGMGMGFGFGLNGGPQASPGAIYGFGIDPLREATQDAAKNNGLSGTGHAVMAVGDAFFGVPAGTAAVVASRSGIVDKAKDIANEALSFLNPSHASSGQAADAGKQK